MKNDFTFTGRTVLLLRVCTIGKDPKGYAWATGLIDRMAKMGAVKKPDGGKDEKPSKGPAVRRRNRA